jgi:uncharacterized secreted protein with C-terminal beta-propeller domain
MRLRVGVVAGVLVLSAAFAAEATAAPARTARLRAFGSCPALLTYAKAHATPFVGAYGFGAPTAVGKVAVPGVAAATSAASGAAVSADNAPTPVEGVDYSGTNVQEQGVDEPDMEKTNGNTMFVVVGNQLNAVDVSGSTPKLLDTLTLTDGWSHELLLNGTHLLVLSRGGYWAEPLPAEPAMIIQPQMSDSTLTEVDVSDPSHLSVLNTMTLDGAYVDARMVNSTVRIVSSSPMPIEPLPYAAASGATSVAAATAKNKAIVANTRVSAWLPTYKVGRHAAQFAVNCRDVYYPPTFSGLGLLTVLTIDLSKGLMPVDSTSIMTDGRIVYASPETLYVSTEQWNYRPLPTTPTEPPMNVADVTTQINAFDISDPTKTTYLGSGSVPGYLLNQWAMSEFQGVLRVVSTDTPAWWGSGPNSQSFLTTLKPQNGSLVQVGQVGGLGQGERVYAVRMIGDTGYVVTFRQVDPLFTIDLHDPASPQVLGQVDIPGYSSYLHPISNNLLLGIGQNVDPTTNEPTGTQVTLFDVSDLKNPKAVVTYSLGQGWSAAEQDHHAFLYWPATNLVVVPFGQQAVALKVTQGGISELGRIVQSQANQSELPQIERSVVDRSSLLTVSDSGVAANSLSSLASLGWAQFPTPAPTPVPVPVVTGVGIGGKGVATGTAVAVAPTKR